MTLSNARGSASLLVNNRFPSSIFTSYHALPVQTNTAQISPLFLLTTWEICSSWAVSMPIMMLGTHAPMIPLLPPEVSTSSSPWFQPVFTCTTQTHQSRFQQENVPLCRKSLSSENMLHSSQGRPRTLVSLLIIFLLLSPLKRLRSLTKRLTGSPSAGKRRKDLSGRLYLVLAPVGNAPSAVSSQQPPSTTSQLGTSGTLSLQSLVRPSPSLGRESRSEQ